MISFVRKPRCVLLVGSTLALVLAGCSSAAEPVPVTSPTAPVIQPGRPGEPNTSLTGAAVTPRPSRALDPDDELFMQDMIVHHAQAIAMVGIAADHLTDTQVKSLASRISDEQKPEIGSMAGWLDGKGLDVPPQATNPLLQDHGAHHSSMKGMATQAQLADLSAARGVASDLLWLQLMIAHHEGAVDMVLTQHRDGIDETVTLLGDEIAVTQQTQINAMRTMVERLS